MTARFGRDDAKPPERDVRIAMAAIVLVAAAGAGYWLGLQHGRRQIRAEVVQRQQAQRAAGAWAQVDQAVTLGPGQTLRQVTIRTGLMPDGSLDPHCLIFTDAVAHTSALTCPGVASSDLDAAN